MNLHLSSFEWSLALARLPRWERLAPKARKAFLKTDGATRAISRSVFGEHAEALLEEGFLDPLLDGQLVDVNKEADRFRKLVRSLGRIRIFEDPGPRSYIQYARRHLTAKHQNQILRDYYSGYHYRTAAEASEESYEKATAESWVLRFLGEESASEFEGRLLGKGEEGLLRTSGNLKQLQRLVRRLLDRGEPVLLSELADDYKARAMSLILRAGIRYLLFFPGLDDQHRPLLGVWPEIITRLNQPDPEPPGTVPVEEEFFSAFLMEDMVQVLIACSHAPLRLRSSDQTLYVKDIRRLREGFIEIPDWLEHTFSFSPEDRINRTNASLAEFGLIARDYKDPDLPGGRVVSTEKASDWLARSAKGRLEDLIAALCLDAPESGRPEPFLPWGLRLSRHLSQQELDQALADCFLGLSVGKFYRCRDFCAYHRAMNNPLRDLSRKGADFVASLGWKTFYNPGTETAESIWSNVLLEFLRTRLWPLGGAKAGLDGGREVCFALTDIGRCFLGAAEDFQYGGREEGRILVQPNFDVVFTSPAPLAEADLGRFAERKGQGLGVLFKITKKSVQEAVGAGLSSERILRSLRRAASQEIPANVEREIEGWAAQCRRVRWRPAILIECPDQESAGLVAAAAGKRGKLLNPTTVQLDGKKRKRTLINKLRKKGVFVDED